LYCPAAAVVEAPDPAGNAAVLAPTGWFG
jgi:hypothetical protein